MEYHQITKQITDLLKRCSFWYETFEREPVRTSEEVAKIRTGYNLNQGVKAIIVRVKISESNKKFVMLVLPGDLRFDNAKIKSIFTAKYVRFAT